MTVIPEPDIFIGICLVTNMALINFLKMLLILITHLQWLLKFGSNDLLATLGLFWHLFLELFYWCLCWLGILIIIAADYFVSITAASMLLIFVGILLGIIRLTPLYFFSNGFKISIDDKCRHRHLIVIILELQCIVSFLWHPISLLAINYHTVGLMLSKYLFTAKTLETVDAKILFVLVFGLILHQAIKVFD